MQTITDILLLAASYFVEWIPNGLTAGATPGEWPWQG
jgi:hypothetical protein